MAELIKFDSGVQEFSLNDCVTVSFCPTDLEFVERLFNTLERLDKKQENYKSLAESTETNADLFDLAHKMDTETRGEINDLFGTDVCTPLWGGGNVFALAGGFPRWANLLFAIVDQLDSEFVKEQKKTNPRLEKYIKKYKR